MVEHPPMSIYAPFSRPLYVMLKPAGALCNLACDYWLHAAVLLYRLVSAMVVGQYQALGRDDFARTATAEDAHGILQRHSVGVVDGISIELQPLFLHQFDRVLLLHQL